MEKIRVYLKLIALDFFTFQLIKKAIKEKCMAGNIRIVTLTTHPTSIFCYSGAFCLVYSSNLNLQHVDVCCKLNKSLNVTYIMKIMEAELANT